VPAAQQPDEKGIEHPVLSNDHLGQLGSQPFAGFSKVSHGRGGLLILDVNGFIRTV
jgi:hypothetical protein